MDDHTEEDDHYYYYYHCYYCYFRHHPMAYDPLDIHQNDEVEDDADDAAEVVVLQIVVDDDEDFLLDVLSYDSNSFPIKPYTIHFHKVSGLIST